MNPVGVYIHIPFCIKKCNYCDFFSIKGNVDLYTQYVKTVINNLNYWKDKLHNKPVDTIYIGGGTPSILGTKLLSKLISYVASAFNVLSDAEITIEVNPNSVNSLDLIYLKTTGVNRVSMGLQSSNDEELKLLGRSHNHSDTIKAIEHIIKSGINNFSLDVMQGIPLQTIESLDKTLDFCINTGATHISTYMLKIEKNTPFYKNPENLVFADEDTIAEMYEYTCNKLLKCGFRHYEISNFCKDNKISRHNMKYWTLDEYIGIGPSAHSLIKGERFYYPSDMKAFENNTILFESEGNTIEEFIMLSLRTDIGLDLIELQNVYKADITPRFINRVGALERNGFLTWRDNRIVLTEKGFLLSNSIISDIIENL